MEDVPKDKRYEYDENGKIDNDRRTYYQDAEIKIKNIKEHKFFKGKPQ